MADSYLTTTIPYVNARPHLGHALELVQADALARRLRARGRAARTQSGTDDHALKNVRAAAAAGVPVREFVDENAAAFEQLGPQLAARPDAFLRTSADPRHPAAVAALWRACAASGDLYRQGYRARYCAGCEQFYDERELEAGARCPEHGTVADWVEEENWFFRLSRYRAPLRRLITDGALRIEPAARRNEVLALIDGGLRDFSVSRSRRRATGPDGALWGVPVPDDPDQVVYVWFDALVNYLTGLGYPDPEGAARWRALERRVHLAGKGVVRFHAVYWPAMLLSAGLPAPTDVLVHDYLTVDGAKISKSAGTAALADPAALAAEFGADAVRWWLLSEVPRSGDVDFTPERLAARTDTDLANGIGNLVNRTVAMLHRYRGGDPAAAAAAAAPDAALAAALDAVTLAVDAAFDGYDLRRGSAAVRALAEEGNRFVDRARPWEAAREGAARAAELDGALGALLLTCRRLAEELVPFTPGLAAALAAQLAEGPDGRLPEPRPLVRRIQLKGRPSPASAPS
ncbi:methionine--tRNA ligase [Mangrovactinospora gilvigrisea]|uniref:methionine--tRNA ligase n=1 Tax=Mangrovactinospora gilvigrisea TaxID=1428644 RepID=A0A1J7CBU2_9ACTN|nr:methionine--tRNA ligase [Mangrovactinospora gilvigrisea]OIV37130.1 methionine--tRNA ligase [Mangrovactinospora gilvigrisea]